MSQSDHVPIPPTDGAFQEFDPAADHEFVSASLIEPGRGNRKNEFLTYNEPDFENSSENPYRDTTESDINLRHLPLAELVPRPWKTFEQVMIASYISVVICFVTGLFAVRYAWRGRRHQSKGLMGMAQRDLNLAVWFIYASAAFGILLFLIIIPVAVSV
jgi:hypothetical protein